MSADDERKPLATATMHGATHGDALTIATWNINSVRLRQQQVAAFLDGWRPDVLCLQEIRCATDAFPARAFRRLGYEHMAVWGRKGHAGVAILSRLPLCNVQRHCFCGLEDARHIMAEVAGVEVHSLYVPAGGDVPDAGRNPKFAHKLAFLDELRTWLARQVQQAASGGREVILTGDLNVAPLPDDVWDHRRLLRVITHTPMETERLETLRAEAGMVDVVRVRLPVPEKVFTWWSYRAGDAWEQHDRGRRLDHVWSTPELAARLEDVAIARETRSWPRPSDHVPVLARFRRR